MKTLIFLFSFPACFILFLKVEVKGQGQFWGMASAGGTNNIGTIFNTSANGSSISVAKSFLAPSNIGAEPTANLLQATNGKIYGMTSMGGANDFSVLFEYDTTTGIYNSKIDFDGVAKGSSPSYLVGGFDAG